jgi:hypothetical protein
MKPTKLSKKNGANGQPYSGINILAFGQQPIANS